MERFGNYVIERELGRGGMGVVYAARHAILGHGVALKILHAEWAQREDVVQRFFNEARAAAAIAHPGIVRVHDVGIMEGAAFLVMDLLAGESLGNRMKTRGPLSIAAAVECTRQIAGALAAAHAVGIVHRDLKPDNIFLAGDGTRAVLLDFGVAKLTGSLSGSDMKTKTGALLGTPHYMSPEQCDGEREIDHRSDLYSLGCMLFHMTSGKLPFEGGIGAVIGAHLHVPPPPLRRALPTAPPEVETIVARLMAKDPAERYASAAELLAALDAWSPSTADHLAPDRIVDISVAETLPVANTGDLTVDTLPPAPSEREVVHARPSIKSKGGDDDGDDADTVREDKPPMLIVEPAPPAPPPPSPSSRRFVLAAGAGLALAGLGLLAFALSRDDTSAQVATVTPDARAVAEPAPRRDAKPRATDAALATVEVDAAGELEPDAALIGATRIDDAASATRDAAIARTVARDAGRDAASDAAAVVAQVDAAALADAQVAAAIVDAAPAGAREQAIQRQLANIANAEADWEASREFMILEVVGQGDPRIKRARDDAKKAIDKLGVAEERKRVHHALVAHDWQRGLDTCRDTWGPTPRVDVVVQCTVFACILKDDAHLEQWAGGIGSPKMLEYIEQFCGRYRK